MRLDHPFLCVVFLLASMVPVSASTNLKLIRSADLQSEFCDAKSQQINSPLSGVDFVSENEVLVYTVCRVGVALSLRDRFRPTDPNHLKAAVVDLTTGAVTKRFDWPTHGHGSGVWVTHAGNLLVHRDNLLRLLTPGGKFLTELWITKPGTENLIRYAMSPAVEAVAITISGLDADGRLFGGSGVLDTRNLHVVSRWPEQAEVWNVAASSSGAARTAGSGPELDVRNFQTNQWRTIAKSGDRSIFRPVFVSDSEFAVPIEDNVELFNISGERVGVFGCPHALSATVSRDGGVVATMCIRNSIGSPSILPVYGAQFGTISFDIYRLASQQHVGALDEPTSPAFRYAFALSPSGQKLAVVDDLKLSVYEIPEP